MPPANGDGFSVDAEVGRDLQLLREENRRLRLELGRRRRGEDSIISEVRAALQILPNPTPPKPPKPTNGKGEEEVAWLFLSDTQIGKVTPTYNIRVAEQRILQSAERLVRFADIRRKQAKINRCVLVLGGDMVEGEGIFPSQAIEIEAGAMVQSVHACPQALSRAITILAAFFPQVDVRCVVGNHGEMRFSLGPVQSNTNFDRIAYEVTELLTRHLTNVDFKIAEEFWWVEDVLGHGQLITHGDAIRGAGTDGPISRAAMGWQDAIPKPWEILHMGHFHNFRVLTVNHRLVVVNGSTESDNLYAQRKLKASSRPLQVSAFFNRAHGMVALMPIYLG